MDKKQNATLASKVLTGRIKKPTHKQILTLAAIVLENAENKSKKPKKK